MGVGISLVETILGLWQEGHFPKNGKVLELGSQQLLLTLNDFDKAVTAYGVEGYERDNFEPWDWENRGACQYASKFYKLLGLDEYTCFDLNGENNAIQHDLNMPFEDRNHFNQYDFVTDFGCAEHIFNVSEPFKTMHKVCKPGGIILNHQHMMNYTNGYYVFDPSFYEDLAAANGYEIIFSGMTVHAESEMKNSGMYTWLVPLSNELVETLDWTKIKMICLLYGFKKINDADFVLPYQEKLMSYKYKNMGYRIACQTNYKRPTRTYVPVIERNENISSKEFKRVCKAYFKKKLGLLK